jgi:hypothetical protein
MKSTMPWTRACSKVDLAGLALALDRLGQVDQAFGGVVPAVEEHVLHVLQQFLGDVLVDLELAGVDDAHVHARAGRVIQERGVHRLAHHVVAAEGEREVRNTAGDVHPRAALADLAAGLDERLAVVVVLLDARGDGQDVRVEDDVVGREVELLAQQLVGALADLDLALLAVGLAGLVEGHDHHAGAEALDRAGLLQEVLGAFLEGDRVHDPLALDALEPGLDDRPLRRVDHDRNARDLGLGGDQVEEARHARLRVQQALVHVDVEDVGAAADLIEGHVQGLVELVLLDQAGELLGAGDVGALTDHLEVGLLADREGLQAREVGHLAVAVALLARGHGLHALGDLGDVRRGRAAAAADDVDDAAGGELGDQLAGDLGLLVVLAEGVGQAGVRIARDVAVRQLGELRHVGPHVLGAQGTVHADGQRAGVGHRAHEGLDRLAREGATGGVGDGHGDHQRQLEAALVLDLVDRGQRGLGVERVEDRLDQEQVHATVDQTADLFGVGGLQIVEVQ